MFIFRLNSVNIGALLSNVQNCGNKVFFDFGFTSLLKNKHPKVNTLLNAFFIRYRYKGIKELHPNEFLKMKFKKFDPL